MVLGGGLLLPLGVEWWRVSRRARGWTQVEKAGSAFTEYSRSLERRPLLTEMMTSAELFTAAGVVRKEPLDKTARMGLAGARASHVESLEVDERKLTTPRALCVLWQGG